MGFLDVQNADPCVPFLLSSFDTRDSDGDGLSDFDEARCAARNSDGADVADFLDTDDDNDGLPTRTELDQCQSQQFQLQVPFADQVSFDGFRFTNVGRACDVDGDGLSVHLDGNSDNDSVARDVDDGTDDIDTDGIVGFLDRNNTDPCEPSSSASACGGDPDAGTGPGGGIDGGVDGPPPP